VIGKYN